MVAHLCPRQFPVRARMCLFSMPSVSSRWRELLKFVELRGTWRLSHPHFYLHLPAFFNRHASFNSRIFASAADDSPLGAPDGRCDLRYRFASLPSSFRRLYCWVHVTVRYRFRSRRMTSEPNPTVNPIERLDSCPRAA